LLLLLADIGFFPESDLFVYANLCQYPKIPVILEMTVRHLGRNTVMSDYSADIKKYTSTVNEAAVAAIVKFCGVSLHNNDAKYVAVSDASEVKTVVNGFCAKKLGLDAKTAEAAVKAVGEKMKADRTKHRVTVYYLLAEHTGTLGKLGLLSNAGVIGSEITEQAGPAATEASRAATSAAPRVTPPPPRSGTNWLSWLIPLIIIAGGLWYFLGQGNHTPTPTKTATSPAVTDMVVGDVDVGKQITAALDGVKTTLGGITDAATAQAALPKLQEAVTAIEGVSGIVGKLSAEQKTSLAALVAAPLPAIKEAAAKILAIQGAGDVVKPVVDTLIAKLEALAKPA
jgi:hypothetical protein